MMLQITVLLLAALNGGWMIFDGIHVIRNGKYFGPPEPGAWSKIISKCGLNPFSIGPLFIFLGVMWLISAIGLVLDFQWGYVALFITAISTLLYIKVVTIISIITICCLALLN